MVDINKVIYGSQDLTVREAVQFLAGLPNIQLASVAATGVQSVTGNTIIVGAGFGQVEILLALSDAAVAADDTLDVYVDSSPDGGTTWVNFVHFTQILGNGANTLNFVAISPRIGTATEENVTADVAAGGTPRPFIGDRLRVRYVIVDPSGTDAVFDFIVTASFKP